MKFLKEQLEKAEPMFSKGGKFAALFPLFEGMFTFFFTPGTVARGRTHVRDGMDLKRIMIMVVFALAPAMVMAIYNTGFQANLALENQSLVEPQTWQQMVYMWFNLSFDSSSWLGNFIHGSLYFFPVYIVTLAVGGAWETLFAIVRKHEINEGFLVTSALFPMILPPMIPLWQVALGISFGVVIGKEIFGGVGKNFMNPALVGRAFLFFAYPGQISGDAVWIAADGVSGATALAQVAEGGASAMTVSWWDAFIGFIPGSMGETSALACLIGAIILIVTGVGSWRIMLSITVSMLIWSLLLFKVGSTSNPAFELAPHWHLVLGGFAFGTVFMATDPVSAAMTRTGQFFYGALIGFMVVLVRVINPAFPEGMMLAILFGNVIAPLIDYYVVKLHIKRRKVRYGIS